MPDALLDILDAFGFFPGEIVTTGYGAHGMYAKDFSIAANLGDIFIRGNNPYAYGMLAEDFSLALNMGNIEVGEYGDENMGGFSHGMGAKNWSAAINAGSITTYPMENAYGMLAEDNSIAVNAGSLVSLGGDFLSSLIPGDPEDPEDENPLSGIIDFVAGIFGGGSSTIETFGYGSSGMVARNWSAAINLDEIITHGDFYSYGMEADNYSAALNWGSITTEGYQADGMAAYNFSLAANFSSDSIETFGDWSDGMVAFFNSMALNTGSILTHGDNSFGMWAYDHSLLANTGYIETGAELPEFDDDDDIGIRQINGSAGGYWSVGMFAENFSTALNLGDIVTHGEEAVGMYATNHSLAVNTGSIKTGSDEELYEPTFNSQVTENGQGSTYDFGSHGMKAVENSIALNFGTVVTEGDNNLGMLAYNNSLIANIDTETIETFGNYAHGMVADTNSLAINTGSILTHGDYAAGMHAVTDSLSMNFGDIETEGLGSQGMSAHFSSTAFNFGSVTTTSDDAYGMWALYDSTIVNTGLIQTSGENSEGMSAFDNSNAFNFGEITTGNSVGIYVDDNSLAVNTGSVTTYGEEEDAYGVVSSNNSAALNLGSITTYGSGAIGMRAASNSMVANFSSGNIKTYGDQSYGMEAANSSMALNTGFIETEGEKAYGISAYDNSVAINSGSIITEGSGAHGMRIRENSMAVNTGTIKTTGEDSNAASIYIGSLFINAGVLDSAEGDAVKANEGSKVILLDGTVLAGSHTLSDDGTSSLDVYMSEDLAAQVVNFGSLTKAGAGTLLLEGGSSVVGETLNTEGTLAIEAGTQFTTQDFTQEEDANLYLFANPDSVTELDAVPLWVYDHASISGSVYIDMSMVSQPGLYRYIRAETYDWDFDTYFVNNPYFTPYDPQWITGGSYLYTSYLGYSFSQAALGMVAAIDDWSLLRHIMANHLQDVASSMRDMEVGEKKIHAHVLAGKTSRDPATATSAGFDSTQKGISVGFDKKQSETTAWGMYLGYTEKDIDFTGPSMVFADWENQDTWHFGGYVSKRWDNWILSNTLTYRKSDHKTFRAQVGGDATASFDSWAITNDLRLGYVAKEIGPDSNWQVIPEVGLNVGYINRGGYTETNGFTYGDYSNTVVESVVGIRFKGEYLRNDGSTFVPQLRLAWVHILSGEDITIDQTWGSDTKWFTETLDRDYFVADIGMSLYKLNNMDISLNYSGRFSDNSTSHGGWLRLQWEF